MRGISREHPRSSTHPEAMLRIHHALHVLLAQEIFAVEQATDVLEQHGRGGADDMTVSEEERTLLVAIGNHQRTIEVLA